MFSEIVDEICAQSNRVNDRELVIKWANEGIRRVEACHYFTSSLIENELTSASQGVVIKQSNVWVWDRTADVRLIRGVKINNKLFPINAQPGISQKSLTNYWYKVGTYFVFVANVPITSIQLAYYSFPPEYKYVPQDNRTLRYDRTDRQYYRKLVDILPVQWEVIPEAELPNYEVAIAALGNWLCRDYKNVIIASGTSSLYAALGDNDRFRSEFAKYKDLLKDVINNEKSANYGYGA